MDKKELARILRKVEAMQTALRTMLLEMNEIASRLRFIPVSQASSSSDDEDEAKMAWTPRPNQCPHN